MRRRDAERDPGRPDLGLRPRQPALHRLARDEERPRDLGGRQAAERAQRQRHLRLERQRRMAAGEDQLQPLVGDRRRRPSRPPPPRAPRAGASWPASVRSRRSRSIARLRAVVTSHAPGLRRRAVARPALGGDRERLLRGLLGEVEVAEEADQGGQHAAPLVAEDLLDQRRTAPRAAAPRPQPPEPGGRDPRRELERRVEVVGLEQVEAAEDLLGVRERAVGDQRLAVVDANGRRRLDGLQLRAADDARVIARAPGTRPTPPRAPRR